MALIIPGTANFTLTVLGMAILQRLFKRLFYLKLFHLKLLWLELFYLKVLWCS
jgi:hypothetical protein